MLKKIFKKDNFILLSLLLLISLISIYINPTFNVLRGGDTGQYILQSENIYSEVSRLRPPIFSFIIYIGKILFGDDWISFLIIFHWTLYLIWIILLLELFNRYNVYRFYAIITIIIFALSPRILLYKYVLLPEFIMAFMIFLIFYFISKLINTKTMLSMHSAIIIGILNAVCYLIKPIWILGGVVTSIFFIYYLKDNHMLRWRFPAILLLSNFTIIFFWQIFLYLNFNQYNISSASTRNLNLLSLRSGYLNEGKGTLLFEHINNNENIYNIANHIKWDDFESFTRLKTLLDNNITTFDNKFYRFAITSNLFDYIINQIKRIPSFFTSKCLSLTNSESLIHFVELNYLRLYKVIYLYLLPFILLLGIFLLINENKYISILILLFVTYYMILCVFVSYQDQSFVRFRTSIDCLLFIFSLLSINRIKYLIYNFITK